MSFDRSGTPQNNSSGGNNELHVLPIPPKHRKLKDVVKIVGRNFRSTPSAFTYYTIHPGKSFHFGFHFEIFGLRCLMFDVWLFCLNERF